MTAMRLHRYPSPSGGVALGKMGCTDLFHRITAKDYVQNGLVAMWDGIENAGWGVHDSQSRVIDLFGGPSLTVLSMGDDYANLVNSNGVSLSTGAVKSCEVVCSVNAAGTNNDNVIFSTSISGSTVKTAKYLYGGLRTGRYSTHANVDIGTTSDYYVLEDEFTAANYGQRFYVAMVSDESSSRIYLNGQLKVNSPVYFDAPTFAKVFAMYNQSARGINGTMCAARLYSRALTADEIARNYNIDKARFGLPDAS